MGILPSPGLAKIDQNAWVLKLFGMDVKGMCTIKSMRYFFFFREKGLKAPAPLQAKKPKLGTDSRDTDQRLKTSLKHKRKEHLAPLRLQAIINKEQNY